MSQFDEAIFNPIHSSYYLHIFTSSNHAKPQKDFKIPLYPSDRNGSKYVIVGYCCHTHEGVHRQCKPQTFVKQIAEGTFSPINKQIIYQQCTKSGTAPKFMTDPYTVIRTQVTQPSLPPNMTRMAHSIWYIPDILLCQGYFYSDDIIHHRQHLSKAEKISIDLEEQTRLSHHLNVPYDIDNYDKMHSGIDIDNIHYSHHLKYSIRLSRKHNELWHHWNRSFLTTYNTEFWGGGKCNRYDIIFESVFDRTLHGCVTVYIPASFYFESDRMHNNTEQLILPSEIVCHSSHPKYTINSELKFSTKQQTYIDSILSFKDSDKFALFLVRDCYKPKYHLEALLRVIFFDLLSSEYKQATSLGGCRRNLKVYNEMGFDYCPKNAFDGHYRNKKYNCSGFGWTDGVVQMARPFKFLIAFENSKIKGYSTEKIFNALYSNAIPIYFGDPMITQYLNANRFIHCNTITNAQIKEIRKLDKSLGLTQLIALVTTIVRSDLLDCIAKVREIDTNDRLYHQMLLEPVFVNNTFKNTVMDPNVIGDKMRYALKLHDSYLVN